MRTGIAQLPLHYGKTPRWLFDRMKFLAREIAIIQLLGMIGVGPKTIRALSLIAELVYGAEVGFRDPVRYSFAHGGKDGHPYPVDGKGYDRSIQILEKAIQQAKLGNREKLDAFKRLANTTVP